MIEPKLYRKVYLISKIDDDDQCRPVDIYIRASLALDNENNKFWQILDDEQNYFDYEFSTLDIYDLTVKWSKNEDPIETHRKKRKKNNPERSRNRLTIKEREEFDEIPF